MTSGGRIVRLCLVVNEQLFQGLGQVLVNLGWQWIHARQRTQDAAKAAYLRGLRVARRQMSETARQPAQNYTNGATAMNNEKMGSGGETGGFVSGMVVGAVLGGLVGAVAALWLAPQSGEQTQRRVKENAVQLRERANDTLSDVKSKVDDATDKVKSNVGDAADKVRETAENVAQQSQAYVQEQARKAGRAAANAQAEMKH